MDVFQILVLLYFVPTIVALWREMPNKGSAIIVNIFLGWTLIGWVVALAMACGRKNPVISSSNSDPNFLPSLPPLTPSRPRPPARPAPPGTLTNPTPRPASHHQSESKKTIKKEYSVRGFEFDRNFLIGWSVFLLLVVGIVALGIYENFANRNSGPIFTFNITGEGIFGNQISPEADDVSYVTVKKLRNSAGEISFYLVFDVTNYSSKESDYTIGAALVCDGFTKYKEELKISGLLPSERKHFERRINDELAVDGCLASIEVSRDATL